MDNWLLHDKEANRQAFVRKPLQLPLQKSWEAEVKGSVLAPPVAAEGYIYVCSLGAIHKLDLLTGNQLWFYRHKEPPKPRINAFKSSPAIWSDKVFFTDSLGTIYCLNKDSGQLVWEKEEYLARNESLCIFENKLFTRSTRQENSNRIYGYACLDMNGRLVWFQPCRGPVRTNGAAIKEGILVFGDAEGYVYALYVENGQLVWQTDIKSLIDDPSLLNEVSAFGLPTIVDNIVIIRVGDYSNFCGLDLHSGEIRWHHVAASNANCIASDETRMYYYRLYDLWQSIDIKTGQLIKTMNSSQHLLGESMSLSGLVIGNHHIAGFNMSTKLAAFNTDTGEVEWTFTGGGGYSAAGIFVDSRLVIGCDDRKVYCFTENSVK